jgi:AcrR family transcriptional regulator
MKAAALFREKGFGTTSMRDLAEMVGMEAASLYNHIDSKSDILRDIITRTALDCMNHMDSLENNNMGNLDKVESLVRFHVQMMLYRFDDYYVMTNEWIHLPEPSLSEFIQQRRDYVQKMESIIRDGIANNEIKDIMPYVAVLTILSSVRGLEFWHRSVKRITAATMEDQMVKYLINGLKSRKPC